MKADFYNANLGRDFPLVHPADLPPDLLADFGCWLLVAQTADEEPGEVSLSHLRLNAGKLELVFISTAAALATSMLVFSCEETTGKYHTLFAQGQPQTPLDELENPAVATLVATLDDEVCGNAPLWEGYLVLGDIAKLISYLQANYDLGDGLYLRNCSLALEPASIVHNGRQLRQIGVANKERTRSQAPSDCREPCWDFVTSDVYVVQSCLNGELQLDDGYGLAVTQTAPTNTLTLLAAPGAGRGQPAEELRLFAGETPPNGFETLTASLRCCDTVRTLGGAAGPLLLFREGDGVRISTYPNLHRIIVDFNFHDLAACPALPDPEDVACIYPSEELCECGPLHPEDFECPETIEPTTETPTTGDEEPSTEETTSLPPGNGGWVVIVCNSNNVTDDVFEIRLNDTVLGVMDFAVTESGCRGLVFITAGDIPASIANSPTLRNTVDVCSCGNSPVALFAENAFVSGQNSLTLRNLKNNGSNNFGRVIVAKVSRNSVGYFVERVELSEYYAPGPGQDFRTYFNHTW